MHMTVRSALLASLTAATLLTAAGCSRQDERAANAKLQAAEAKLDAAGAKVDTVVAKAEAKTDAIGRTAETKLDNAVTRVGAAVEDAKITAAINARLAEDPALSALRINVNTTGGRVSLLGTAPDMAARDRATQLARAVEGVQAVDNKLEVRG